LPDHVASWEQVIQSLFDGEKSTNV